jgi:hypothetical protein
MRVHRAYFTAGATNAPVSTTESEPVTSQTYASGGGVSFFGTSGQRTDSGQKGPSYAVAKVTPENRAVRTYSPTKKSIDGLRELGFTAANVTPTRGVIRGTSALVALAELDPNELIIKPDVFQHIAFETREGGEESDPYPGSLMGAIATVRQSFFDAQHYALDQADWQKDSHRPQAPGIRSRARSASRPLSKPKCAVMFEPGSALMVDRALA